MLLSLRLSALAALQLASAPPPARGPLPTLHTGDLVFIRSKSSRSDLIRRASHSPYSHVGVVEVTDEGVFVIEAVQPVSRTPWNHFVARADHRRVTVARVTDLDDAALERVITSAKASLGKPYDARYRWDDERLYCSELVVKAFARGADVSLGRKQRVRELALSAAELTLAKTLGIAPDTELVTPSSLLEGERVQVVARDVAW